MRHLVAILVATVLIAGVQDVQAGDKQPGLGDTFAHFVMDAKNHANSVGEFEAFYRVELSKPVTEEERQAIALWGDLFLCLMRDDDAHGGELGLKAENRDTDCRLSVQGRKYGLFTPAARKLERQINYGSLEPVKGTYACMIDRLRAARTFLGFTRCLDKTP